MTTHDDKGVPIVPKRRKRSVPEDEQIDAGSAPELTRPDDEPTVGGVLLVQGRSGWVLIDVEIPESQVPRYSTKVREGEVAQIVFAQAEQRLGAIVERASKSRWAATTKSGSLTVENALERLHEAIDELHEAYWGDAMSREEASAALCAFCETGKVTTIGRSPTGDDRARLQRLVTALGAGEGRPARGYWPAVKP